MFMCGDCHEILAKQRFSTKYCESHLHSKTLFHSHWIRFQFVINNLAAYFLALVQERKCKVTGQLLSLLLTAFITCFYKIKPCTAQLVEVIANYCWEFFHYTYMECLILHALTGAPDESLQFASLQALSWKTLFLVPLVACRGSVTSCTHPIFVAKNQAARVEFSLTVIHSLWCMLLSVKSDRPEVSTWDNSYL